ncbi:glycoside hydrolase family 3 protein [Demequina sp. NBRC 110052]|uniref:glycoside hydrolase family 3 protein n=1 Tax=Demequina sp. NBRC 110052 TaxID=1570341 RepID=UPI000A04E514|nr:glycoside hydrolase family 3 protein [Demequina sp. NBRC 110052]
MKVRSVVTVSLIGLLALSGCSPEPTVDPAPSDGIDRSYLDSSLPLETRVEVLLSQMTQAEKLGQMTQVEEDSLEPGDVALLNLGSVLHGGGGLQGASDAAAWKATVLEHQREAMEDTRLGIPLLYGIDAVHGFGGMDGATVFPHQIGLGAANDPELMTQIGHATAQELAAVGIRWNFAPVLAMPGDIRWGRTYETYSQDPDVVASLGTAYLRGLQGSDLADPSTVLATPKHFVGDGATVYGTSTQIIQVPYLLDQGDAPADPALLEGSLLPPYRAAIDAGARSIMASFSSWGGEKVHGDATLLTDTLRGELGFTGFVVSDWGGCDQVAAKTGFEKVAQCVNAGVDMVMTPFDGEGFQSSLEMAVSRGDVSQARIDEAVSRILTVKFQMGLFDGPVDPAVPTDVVGSAEHRELARRAVQESQVLLSNDGVLPIGPEVRTIAVVGDAADDMGVQAGGWTRSWQGDVGPVIPGTTIAEGIQQRAGADVLVTVGMPDSGQVDLCIAAAGEVPYAEGMGDSTTLALPGLTVLDELGDRCASTVLVVVTGRPVLITNTVDRVDAVVVAWLPGTAGEGIADTLFGDVPFTGTLPVNWPRNLDQVPTAPDGEEYLFPIGFGLTG